LFQSNAQAFITNKKKNQEPLKLMTDEICTTNGMSGFDSGETEWLDFITSQVNDLIYPDKSKHISQPKVASSIKWHTEKFWQLGINTLGDNLDKQLYYLKRIKKATTKKKKNNIEPISYKSTICKQSNTT
jgi:hypothetical protein